MLAQDVVHCATHARANMPKQCDALGIAVRKGPSLLGDSVFFFILVLIIKWGWKISA